MAFKFGKDDRHETGSKKLAYFILLRRASDCLLPSISLHLSQFRTYGNNKISRNAAIATIPLYGGGRLGDLPDYCAGRLAGWLGRQ